MSSFLDDCEWQRRLDENFTATYTNLTNTSTSTSTSTSIIDGLLLSPKRKRNKNNPDNTTDSNGTVYSGKRTRMSLPVISYSQATPDMRFCKNEEEGGGGCGAVSGTSSCANTNNGVEPALEQRLGPRNTKTAKSTNTSLSDPQDNTKRSSSKKHISWEERRQQLVVFKNKFRHTNVPQRYAENNQLATWVNTQRSQYKLLKAGKKSHMTRERIQSLDELGFEWKVHVYTWEEHRQQLADFKEKFHSTNVPRPYAENRPLGNWVTNQRTHYKLFKASSKRSSMTRERIQSLEKLGFEWVMRSRSSLYTWRKYRQQLADFKEILRHTNVPQKYAENKPLAIWVTTQRKEYKLFKASKKSSMTKERVKSLEKLGFEWKPKLGRSSSSLVETSPIVLSTQDGYESDTSEFYLII